MQDKFPQNLLRRLTQNPLRRSARHSLRWPSLQSLPPLDRARIGVMRHRVAHRLDHRRRATVAAAAALALIGMGAVTANATEPAGPDGPTSTYAAQILDERQDATDRAARSGRALASPAGDAAAAAGDQATGSHTTAVAAAESPAPDWVHPMPQARTTSCFGWRWGQIHAGVDLAAPEGTPIRAVGAGTVTHAGWEFGGYGISVVIDHHDGHYTHYAHASKALVSKGDKVTPGQEIAREGNTGDSQGPHLHFEVHKGSLWNQVEPTQWMNNRNVTIGGC